MGVRKLFQFPCLLLVLSISLGETHARLFTLPKPGTSDACIMVDVDFKADIQAIKKQQVVATKTLTSDDKGITTTGLCNGTTNELLIEFEKHTFWYIAFHQRGDEAKAVSQYRGLQFLPTDIFGQAVPVQKQQIFYDSHPVDQKNSNDSFFCSDKQQTAYLNTGPSAGDFSFHLNVTIFSIQSQGFNIKNNEFGPREYC